MSRTEQSLRNLIPVESPEWVPSTGINGWNVIYQSNHTFKISETYFTEAEITRQVLDLHSRFTLNMEENNEGNEDKIKSLFAKFKDFEAHQVKFEFPVTQRTVDNPLVEELESNINNDFPSVKGTCHITFNTMKPGIDNILVPKQITLKNIPVEGIVEKTENIYYWKLNLNSQIIYYQMLFIVNAVTNLEETFLQFNDLDREKIDDLKYYLDKINKVIEIRRNSYIA